MRKKTKLNWSALADRQLVELHKRIADTGTPKMAKSFTRRLRKHANVLRDFPEIGSVVEEFQIESILEIGFRGYRIVYDYDGVRVLILTVIHGSAELKL